ncbi:hypothetical protein QL996_12930 [Planococcus sp. APC 4015]|nr:hypothetical protein [Planococcus sp. APC 4015]
MTVVGDQRPVRRRSPLDPHSSTFHAFADMLYAGVLIFVLALPVVTWFAALSAGVEAIRDARAADHHVRARTVWSAFVDRVVRHPVSHLLAPTAVTALLVVDVVLLPYAAPGELWSLVLPIVLAAGLGAIALRIAGTWRRGEAPRVLLGRAWRRMSTDAAGSALLVLAVTCAGALVVIAPLLALVLPGGLALAAVAMDRDGEGHP